ncbi:MAG: hypothetical protein V1872_12345, partial [bacterium]
FILLFFTHHYLYLQHKKYTLERSNLFLAFGYLWLIELGLDSYSYYLLTTQTKIIQAGYLFFPVIIAFMGISFIRHTPWFFYETENDFYPLLGWIFIVLSSIFFISKAMEYYHF